MIVAGGVYIEHCLTPLSLSLMGSGGRASLALAALGETVTLHTFSPSDTIEDLQANFAPQGVRVVLHESAAQVEFSYLHPLSYPRVSPIPLPQADDAIIQGEMVLRFGCLEASFVVDAETAVYDPQSGGCPRGFRDNGSKAGRLAIVMNSHEVRLLSGTSNLREAASLITREDAAEVVIIKDGAVGAHVFIQSSLAGTVPAYQSEGVYKIGSGDVFTAAFSHYWSAGAHPCRAADLASQHVAHYVSTRQFVSSAELPPRKARRPASGAALNVHVICETSTTPAVWLLNEVTQSLADLGANVFAASENRPGIGTKEETDTSWRPDVVLAVLPASDAAMAAVKGSLEQGLPVVVFAQPACAGAELSTLGCRVEDDLATAIYATMWLGA